MSECTIKELTTCGVCEFCIDDLQVTCKKKWAEVIPDRLILELQQARAERDSYRAALAELASWQEGELFEFEVSDLTLDTYNTLLLMSHPDEDEVPEMPRGEGYGVQG